LEFASYHLHDGGHLSSPAHAAYDFGAGDFSIEAWVKTLSGGTIVGRKSTEGGAGAGGFLLVADPAGKLKFATDDGSTFAEFDSAACSVCDGVWHHVAGVRQGTSIQIFLDGILLPGAMRGSAGTALNVNNTLPLTIGTVAQAQEPYRDFSGAVAEVKLWDHARSAADVTDGLSHRLLPGTAGLVGYWPGEFGLALDFSPIGNVTQAVGMVTPSTDAPPAAAGDVPPMLFLFRGAYTAMTRAGGAVGWWSAAAPLYLTSTGFLVVNNVVVVGATISGNGVAWLDQNNSTNGSITFKIGSSNHYIWPDLPEPVNLFEGSIQFQASGGGTRPGPLDYRGLIQPERVGCGLILNIGSGLVLASNPAAVGDAVNLAPKTALLHDHYCIYDSNIIQQMTSGLAVAVSGSLSAGAPVCFATTTAGEAGQQWHFTAEGMLCLSQAPSLALAVDSSASPARVVVAAASSVDPHQQWAMLSNPQILWNGVAPNVLAGLRSPNGLFDQLSLSPKAEGAAEQLWYFVNQALVCDVNGWALSVVGAAIPGATVKLSPLSSADTAQAFTFQQGRLVHVASGLPLEAGAAGGTVVLGAATDTTPSASWTLSALEPATSMTPHFRTLQASLGTDPANVLYSVVIETDNVIFGGTDDRVEIALVGDQGTSAWFTLSQSLTHIDDPFERGNIDLFKISAPSVGNLKRVNVRYGQNTWFAPETWMVDKISVYDPTTLTTYWNWLRAFQMPSHTSIELNQSIMAGAGSVMSLCKAPTQDAVTNGWVDHTWLTVSDAAQTTYFDCAGGHGGEGSMLDVVTTTCDLNSAVKMATAFNIDAAHPWQSAYGTADVEGRQTCGVRTSGFRNWDGQCHQIANRLLWIGSPQKMIADAPIDKQVVGFGLSSTLWGIYGLGFADWCRASGFPTPPSNGSCFFDFVRRFATRPEATKIYYHANDLHAATSADHQSPNGPAVKAFFQALEADGISNETMAAFTWLPLARIQEELA
jgi:hypothetical protein